MFEQSFKNIDDILHKDAGCGSELDYVEQTSWVLFLKYLDDLEKLFCENSLVMNSTLKGRVFTKLEFEEVIQTAFIKTKNDKYGFWCLTLIAEAKVIGVSGLHEFNYAGKESYELGFILNENYWGRGLATEIGNFWLDYAKKEMSLLELMATVKPTNTASRKVLLENGNMSSATILFVLEEMLRNRPSSKDEFIACAFGPGLTLESALISYV